MTANSGVIYYAVGDDCIEQAIASAQSLKHHNDLPVTLYSDKDLDSVYIDDVITIRSNEYPFFDRINYFRQTPYDKTVYLDTDTVIVGDITSVFDMMDRFDIVASINETRDTAVEGHKFNTTDIDVPESFPEYQCGVIGFCDNPKIMSLFDDWQSRYKQYRDKYILDQPFFREAIYHGDIDLGTLPTEYNALINLGGYFEQEIRIVHLAGSKPEHVPFTSKNTTKERINDIDVEVPTKRVIYYDSMNRLRVKNTYGNTSMLANSLLRIKNGLIEGILQLTKSLYDPEKRNN